MRKDIMAGTVIFLLCDAQHIVCTLNATRKAKMADNENNAFIINLL
jgi:hypothetical protein